MPERGHRADARREPVGRLKAPGELPQRAFHVMLNPGEECRHKDDFVHGHSRRLTGWYFNQIGRMRQFAEIPSRRGPGANAHVNRFRL
jgi:hypothetical protein